MRTQAIVQRTIVHNICSKLFFSRKLSRSNRFGNENKDGKALR